MVASQLIGSSASVTVQTYTASNAPFMPDLNSAVQTSPTNLLLRTQFVRINAAPGQCLNFREVRGVGKGGRCFVTTCCGPVFYVHLFFLSRCSLSLTLHLQVYIFNENYVNVALLKPTSGTAM